ncbi:MAG: hypothetical protein AB7K24_32985 [Gemmataceae bacterium]
MGQPHGRKIPLSLPRQFICDLMWASRGMPIVAAERRMQLGAVAQARQAASPRPGWCALFLKAYGLVAARSPVLRRAYCTFPYPHLYEHPINVASVSVARTYADEDAVFFGHIRTPDRQTLVDIDGHLRRYQSEPVEAVPIFRRMLKISRVPLPLRRWLWWLGLNGSGRRRAQHFGTFGISVVAGQGAGLGRLISPLATTLNYGPLAEDGTMEVRLNFDHRVLDGLVAARALADLEELLATEIVNELKSLHQHAA